MSFLLDTNFVSEMTKTERDPGVEAWLRDVKPSVLFISVVTIAELRYGVEKLPLSRRRDEHERNFTGQVLVSFKGRILPTTEAVAQRFGRLKARLRRSGNTTADLDILIAATAAVHGHTVVTRNEKHFRPTRVPMLNPWSEPESSE